MVSERCWGKKKGVTWAVRSGGSWAALWVAKMAVSLVECLAGS